MRSVLIAVLALAGCSHLDQLASAAKRGTHALDTAAKVACVAEYRPECDEIIAALEAAREAVDEAAEAAQKLDK